MPTIRSAPSSLEILGPRRPGDEQVLTLEALAFVTDLAREFGPRIDALLQARRVRQARFDAGERPDFLPQTAAVRESAWTVAPLPHDLQDRRVEITGPVECKMIINALNSGARVFMADFEDSNTPTWDNIVQGQLHLRDAVAGTIRYVAPETGKVYQLVPRPAVLMVRPRGLHLPEKHLRLDGRPLPGSLVDFGLFAFHNAHTLLQKGSGPYFYLPKLQGHLEARLWNDVFLRAQTALGLPRGTFKATVLIETLPAAFEMDEILFELREHSAGLNCGRWDYIFSFIKTLRRDPARVLPDRARVTMDKGFLRAYVQLLIRTCHRRHVHAMGGMAAYIPVKDDPAANAAALAQVRADKLREVLDGHDGTWVAHPGLVPLATQVFDQHMPTPHQIHRRLDDVNVTRDDLLAVPDGPRTEAGLRHGLRVGLQYLESWLRGAGCVPLYNLMEDAATAEICRAQIWQWIHHQATLDDGRPVTVARFRRLAAEELQALRAKLGPARFEGGRFGEAARLFDDLVTSDDFTEFLTLPAYERVLTLAPAPNAPRDAGPAGAAMSSAPSAVPPAGARFTPPPRDEAFERARWQGLTRLYSRADVERLRGSLSIRHTLAERGALRLWHLLHDEPYVHALGAITGNQAVQMARAGLHAIYVSGWQVAADGNSAAQTYPDQSLYPADSVPHLVRRINRALQRADQIEHADGALTRDWFLPVVADAEAGFGGPLNAFELMKALIEAGAAGVHYEDQVAAAKKCGHMGGKVLVPTGQFLRTLTAARLAADVLDVPVLLIARTDADSAKLLLSDADPRDEAFIDRRQGRTSEGFYHLRGGLECAIARARAYAPYADLLWCETSTPDLDEARRFAEGVQRDFPGKLLAYNCSPSFNWKRHLDDPAIARFQRELGAMGYKFQFVTLAGFHALNYSMFELAFGYQGSDMAAYTHLQQDEFAAEEHGYTATRHQHEVGAAYFDQVMQVIAGGHASTLAMEESTEAKQFA